MIPQENLLIRKKKKEKLTLSKFELKFFALSIF